MQQSQLSRYFFYGVYCILTSLGISTDVQVWILGDDSWRLVHGIASWALITAVASNVHAYMLSMYIYKWLMCPLSMCSCFDILGFGHERSSVFECRKRSLKSCLHTAEGI